MTRPETRSPHAEPMEANGRRRLIKRTMLLLIFLLLCAGMLHVNIRQYQTKRNRHFDKLISEIETSYKVIVEAHQKTSTIAFEYHIDQPEVKAILARALDARGPGDPEREAARRDLHKLLFPHYQRMVQRGVRQLHFHFPDAESFLRFHRPNRYGDSLKGVRYSVELANRRHSPVFGFEEGRIFNGFRCVFPISEDGRHLGTVEISQGFKAITRDMEKLFPQDYVFLIKRTVVVDKVFENENKNYRPSDLSDEYLYEHTFEPSEARLQANAFLKPSLADALEAGKPFAAPANAEREQLAVFLPITNVEGKLSAWIVAYDDDPTVKGYYEEFLNGSVTGLTGIALIYSLFLILIKKNRKLEREKERYRISQGRYRQIFETNQAVKLIVDPKDGQIVQANGAAVRFYGYPYSTLTRKKITDLNTLPPDEVQRAMEQAKSKGKLYFNFTHRLASGDIREVEVYSGPVHDEVGNRVLLYSIVHDVTERRNAEISLRQLSRAVEHSGVAILVTDREGRITYVNPAFTVITGYEADEVIGKNPNLLKSQETPSHRYRELWETLMAGENWRGQFLNRKRDGSLFHANSVISPIRDESGKVTHYVGIQEDVSDKKNMELQLMRQERLAAVGQLSAGIAHDFNNILTSIIGYTELLKYTPDLPDYMNRNLDNIVSASQRAADLVKQLLDFGRRTIRQKQQLDLDELVKEVLGDLNANLPNTLSLRWEIQPGSYPLQGDANQLQQVLSNIVVNAREAMKEKGSIWVTLETVHRKADTLCAVCGQTIEGRLYHLAIHDTGPGVPREKLVHIFEPFFTTKEIGEGSGLGLSQVAGIIQQHNGHITVENREGAGFTIAIFLPVGVHKISEVKPRHPPITLLGQSQTILLVDDEPTLLESISEILHRLNYEVKTAGCGKDALEIFKRHPGEIELVLSDMVMPDMSGEALYQILKIKQADLRFVVMSGYPLEEKGAKLLESGIVDWIEKPVNITRLSQVIGQALKPKHAGRWG